MAHHIAAHDVEQDIAINTSAGVIEGSLAIPEAASGIVLFAHGSGSSRHSARNQFVARALRERGFATLLFDLLTADEDLIDKRTSHLRFDIPLFAERVQRATTWLLEDAATSKLPIGYFGASTGAAAALVAAADLPEIKAVVSRGGRPDLAHEALPRVAAATLLVVGELDHEVIELNRQAFAQLSEAEKDFQVVPGATHLFEEPGALERVVQLAGDWFAAYLVDDAG